MGVGPRACGAGRRQNVLGTHALPSELIAPCRERKSKQGFGKIHLSRRHSSVSRWQPTPLFFLGSFLSTQGSEILASADTAVAERECGVRGGDSRSNRVINSLCVCQQCSEPQCLQNSREDIRTGFLTRGN